MSSSSSESFSGSKNLAYLSKKGVGYGSGSNDTTWMTHYSNGYENPVEKQ